MTVILVAIILAFTWVITEKSDSYSEPQEALFAVDHDLTLIPSYKINDKALFFFIKDTNNLGAAYVQEGLFGWKADILTWSPMGSNRDYNDNLNWIQGQGENLLYGLIRNGDDRIVKVGEEQATILNLAMLPIKEIEEHQLDGLYIWYLESSQPLTSGEIRLMDRETGKELDMADF